MRLSTRMALSFVLALVTLFALTETALAHERRTVGAYQFVAGWIVEPAFEGQKNGVDLRVTDATTGKPVEGVEKTLKVEVTHVPTQKTLTKDLRTIFNDPGHYTADILPTAAGVFQLRFFGKVNDADINETFVSRGGGGNFGDIESIENIQFPEKLAAAREVEGAARGAQTAANDAQDAAEAAQDNASTATTLAYVGIAVGLLGLVAGGAGLLAGRKPR